MDFMKSIAIAASGLRAQAGRMRIISENIANADSTAQTSGGEPYRRKMVTFTSEMDRVFYYRQPALVEREGFFADGIHPSEQGYADWSAAMIKYFSETYEW